jgi:hypothetical protein
MFRLWKILVMMIGVFLIFLGVGLVIMSFIRGMRLVFLLDRRQFPFLTHGCMAVVVIADNGLTGEWDDFRRSDIK